MAHRKKFLTTGIGLLALSSGVFSHGQQKPPFQGKVLIDKGQTAIKMVEVVGRGKYGAAFERVLPLEAVDSGYGTWKIRSAMKTPPIKGGGLIAEIRKKDGSFLTFQLTK